MASNSADYWVVVNERHMHGRAQDRSLSYAPTHNNESLIADGRLSMWRV